MRLPPDASKDEINAFEFPPPSSPDRLHPTEAAALLVAEREARKRADHKYGWLRSSGSLACLRQGASDGERQQWARASRRLRAWGLMRRQTGLVMALRGSLAITEAGRAYVAEHKAVLNKSARRATAAVAREIRLAAAASRLGRARSKRNG